MEDGARFRCERQHELDADGMRREVGAKVTTALWMAIEALEGEAEALRVLATIDGRNGDSGGTSLAESAESDARLLRDLASKHLPDEYETQETGDAR